MSVRTIFHHYVDGRLSEWAMAVAMFGLGVQLMIWPSAVEAAAFHYLAMAGGAYLGPLFLAVSVARVAALVVNGRSCIYGPRARALGAAVGATIWAQMDCALVALLASSPAPTSPEIPVYFALTLCELITSYRAATDVRYRPRA